MRQRIKIRKTSTGEIVKPEASAKPNGYIYFVPQPRQDKKPIAMVFAMEGIEQFNKKIQS